MILEIDITRLEADPRSANVCSVDIRRKLKANFQRNNLYSPLIVRPHPAKHGHYILIDGHHRKEILEELGVKEVLCQIWDISDEEAQLALVNLNRLRGTDVPRKRAELIANLTKTIAPADLTQLIPETEAQIQDLLALIQQDQEAMKERLEAEIQQEKESLPIPLHFLISAKNFPVWEQAYSAFAGESKDRGEVLIQICQTALEGKTNG